MNFPVDQFTGTGIATTFNLTYTPASAASLLVYVGGVKQTSYTGNPSYYVDGNRLIFTAAPANGTPIEVNYLGLLSQVNVPADQSITASMLSLPITNTFVTLITANGTQSSFSLTSTPVSSTSLVVTANGVVQYDYTVSGSTLNLGFTPSAGTLIRAQALGLSQQNIPNDGSVTSTKLDTNLTLSGTFTANSINVTNGFLQVPVGTSSTRPTANAGSIRFNTTLNTLESANGTAWSNVGSGSASSGSGGVSWQPVQNSNFIAVSGNGYAINTQIANVTVTLPASPTVGNFVSLVDYKGTFSSNNLILYPNGNKINGNTSNVYLSTNGQGVSLVYIDSTQGWINYASASAIGPYNVEALIIAGGGGGGQDVAGGGGAGGVYYVSSITLNPGNSLTATVGAGGSGTTAYSTVGTSGGNSSFSGYTAIGGGYAGGWGTAYKDGASGGSGGGGGGGGGGGNAPIGNAGSGTPGQGNPGGVGGGGSSYDGYGLGGGGGGAGGSGSGSNSNPPNGGAGTGAYSTWATATSTGVGGYYAGGGGGNSNSANYPGSGGSGGGGNSSTTSVYAQSGVTNTGSGGGGAGGGSSGIDSVAGGGGSGLVIIRYLGNRRATGGIIVSANGYTYHTFTSSGTFVA